ncbi:MAG: sulfite exporter TauE/SafE family protein [Elusimicrobiota bacterium]
MINGFLLGLSNNLFCFLNCAVVFIPYALASKNKSYISITLFMAGRLIAYVFFGFAAGYTSLYFDGRIDPLYYHFFTLLMSLWLIAFALGKLNLKLSACAWMGSRFSGKTFPLFLGILMGLNICPPFMLGLSETLQMSSVLKPVVFFLGFYLGSSLWLLVFLFTGKLAQLKFISLSAKIISLLVGLYYFGISVSKLAYFIL